MSRYLYPVHVKPLEPRIFPKAVNELCGAWLTNKMAGSVPPYPEAIICMRILLKLAGIHLPRDGLWNNIINQALGPLIADREMAT